MHACKFLFYFFLDLHAIIFVERRCTAVILSKLINFQLQADYDNFAGIYSEYVMGHGLDANIKLADGFMRSKEQNKILGSFKRGDFHILVATSVVEEGLDVCQCNLVVRFDGIKNYREYAQSKGRACAKDSKFIIMAESSEERDVVQQHMVWIDLFIIYYVIKKKVKKLVVYFQYCFQISFIYCNLYIMLFKITNKNLFVSFCHPSTHLPK